MPACASGLLDVDAAGQRARVVEGNLEDVLGASTYGQMIAGARGKR